jgi:hypothetical protein
MPVSILPEFQCCLIRRHLGHGKGTRLVLIKASGEVEVTGNPDWHISPKAWHVVGSLEDVIREAMPPV